MERPARLLTKSPLLANRPPVRRLIVRRTLLRFSRDRTTGGKLGGARGRKPRCRWSNGDREVQRSGEGYGRHRQAGCCAVTPESARAGQPRAPCASGVEAAGGITGEDRRRGSSRVPVGGGQHGAERPPDEPAPLGQGTLPAAAAVARAAGEQAHRHTHAEAATGAGRRTEHESTAGLTTPSRGASHGLKEGPDGGGCGIPRPAGS